LILVDSSVWINYFNGNDTPATKKLEELLNRQRLTLGQLAGAVPVSAQIWRARIAVGDLILTEVLQGFTDPNEFSAARAVLLNFNLIELGGREIAIQAAKNFRALRNAGIVRKTIDTLIATRCIEGGHELLYDDRHFDVFAEHLGLRVVV
jgi:hypothetical protein